MLAAFAVVLAVMGVSGSMAPAEDNLRLNRVRQAGDLAAAQAAVMLQADIAIACLIVQSFPKSGQNASLMPIITTLVHNHPTIANVVIVDSSDRVVLDVLHDALLAQNGPDKMLSNVMPGEWRDIARDGTGARQSILVHTNEADMSNAYFGVMQTEQGVSPRHIYVLNAVHIAPVSSMDQSPTWLLGDDGVVLARSDLQGPTLDSHELGPHWRSARRSGEVSGSLTMAIGARDHLVFYRQLDGWPATLVIDAGLADIVHQNPSLSPVASNAIGLCFVLVAGAMTAWACLKLQSCMPKAAFAESAGHGVSMRQLAAVIAHDLNNMLMVMMVDPTKRVRGAENDTGQTERRQLMRDATKRGLLLSQTLLAYSERLVLQPSVVDLSAALEQLYAECSEALSPNQVLLLALPKPGPFPPLITADSSALNICLLNMLHHVATVASPKATIRIDLRVADEGGMVVLTMSDADILDCVADSVDVTGQMLEFQPNLHDRRMGLALPAAAGFARQSGGAIQVANGGDAFLRISLHLPAHAAGIMERPAVRNLLSDKNDHFTSLPSKTMPEAGQPVRVLVADDSILVRHSIVRWLGSKGYVVMTADSVAQAEVLLSDDIDLLITDIVFDDVEDGFSLALKAREMNPSLPLVFMSGYLSARQPLLLAGDELASFVRKPIGGEELCAVVEGLLALRETQRLQPNSKLTHA